MASDPADKTRVTLDKKGVVSKVHDEKTEHLVWKKGRHTSQDPAIDGEHYQWRLEEYTKSGIPNIRYSGIVSVATNQHKKGHLNTVKVDLPKVVLLDCGLWGAYKRAREYGLEPDSEGPQRDFGLIENGHVWRAQYLSALKKSKQYLKSVTEKTCEELRNSGAALGLALAHLVADSGVGAIRLWQHTKATRPKSLPGSEADDPDWNSLYISFPDLHLSDRWPDVPPMASRHPDSKKRLTLQTVLRDCQSWPGLIRGSKNGKWYAEKVQEYIEDLQKRGLLSRWEEGRRGNFPGEPTFKLTRGLISGLARSYIYTPAQFLAEKDVVDRALRIHSTWFCGPGMAYVTDKSYEKAPVFGKEGDALYEALLDRAPGDAGPAFDLVNFLVAIYSLRTLLSLEWAGVKRDFHNLSEEDAKKIEAGWDKRMPDHVRVRQVGDMCEMWMNHEFLYHGLWVRQTGAGTPIARSLGRRSVKGWGWTCEDIQARKDEYHFHPDVGKQDQIYILAGDHLVNMPGSQRRHAKWYTYNHMNTRDQKYRHVVGDMIKDVYFGDDKIEELEEAFHLPPGEIYRRRVLLFKRMASVKSFSLPLPGCYSGRNIALTPLAKDIEDLSDTHYNHLAGFYLAHLGKLINAPEGGTRRGRMCWMFDETPLAKAFEPALPAGPGYCRTNVLGQQEVLWNKLILDLFGAVGGESVYGNHDGYRGDPLLWGYLDPQYRSHGWLSVPGLWFEHGHRWDQYNRDGCAFGSGMTNLVYYYMHILGGYSTGGKTTRKLEGKYSQERQLQQASAATWFLLVHFRDDLAWLKQELAASSDKRKVHPFGIYVCGHSHTAKLIDIELGMTKKERKRLWKQKKKEEDEQRKQEDKRKKEQRKQEDKRKKEQAKIDKKKKDRADRLVSKRKKSDEARKYKPLTYGRERNRPYQYKSEGLAEEEEKRYKVTLTQETDDEALAWLKRQGPPTR